MRNPADTVSAASAAPRQARIASLHASIQAEPWKWDYYQTLRLLECLHPESPRIGSASRPADEPVRLGQEPALSFAPASLSALVPGRDGAPPRLEVRFFGLFGPNGPLPLHLTEYARGRLMHAGDPSFARFADIIHHRFLSLFYRAWAQAQPCVSLDRPQQDRFGAYVGALCGIGLPTLRDRDALPDFAKLHHAGLLNRQVRNAEGLASLVGGFFGVPVAVEQFVGHWMPLRERDRTRLGSGRSRLGRNALAGRRVWDCQHKFRLCIGPLSLDEYRNFLPGADGIEALVAAVRNYAGHEYEWDARFLLKADSVPPLRLGASARLGYSSWLGRRQGDEPAGDLVLDAQGAAARFRGRA